MLLILSALGKNALCSEPARRIMDSYPQFSTLGIARAGGGELDLSIGFWPASDCSALPQTQGIIIHLTEG
jgi:hypothetical protein